MRVIDEAGNQLGIMSSYDARKTAEEKGLDLVKISPNVSPPVCKIMDYGKYKFDTAKKEKDAKRNQKQSELKEVWLSMTIDTHDLETKARHACKFLASGDKVKVSIRMKGRQQAHAQFGYDVMKRFFDLCAACGTKDEKGTYTEGRNIIMMLSPLKK